MNPTSEIGMETIAQNSYYGALVAGLLGIVLLIGVIYFGSQRSKMDLAIDTGAHAMPPLPADDPHTIPNVIRNSSLKTATYAMILAVVVGTLGMAYLAFKNGALSELSLGSYVLIGLAALLVYVIIRMVEESVNVTQEKAEQFPVSVYNSIVAIENLITASLAVMVFYIGVAYLTYTGAKSAVASATVTASGATAAATAGSTNPSSKIPGGFVNYAALNPLRARAVDGFKPSA